MNRSRRIMRWMPWAVAAVVSTVACRTNERTVTSSNQLAGARTNERANRAAPAEASPMPKGQYDAERGDYSLIDVGPLPLDAELRTLTRDFRSWDGDRRRRAQRATSMDELYTLVHFSKRSAVFAMREKSAARCEDGLTALSMIDEQRIDPRDAAWAVGVLDHAIRVAGADRASLLKAAAALASPGMAKLLDATRAPGALSDWGYAEVQTDRGVGLIRSGSAHYRPTRDMTSLAIKLAATLERGRYVADPEVASELPAVWFAKEHRGDAENLLRQSVATIAVNGTLRKNTTKAAGMQQFNEWVVEMPAEQDASALQSYVGDAASGRVSVGTASGRLFALLVAGSFMEGIEPFESKETLAVLAADARSLLAEADAAGGAARGVQR